MAPSCTDYDWKVEWFFWVSGVTFIKMCCCTGVASNFTLYSCICKASGFVQMCCVRVKKINFFCMAVLKNRVVMSRLMWPPVAAMW